MATVEHPDSLRMPHDHNARMRQACARAEWELGDASWAHIIIDAYLHPGRDAEELARSKGEYDA